MALSPEQQIGSYSITREIGRGGMGVVYLGRDTRLDRPVAIKALPEHLASDPMRLERFEREARTLAQLNHPNVAGIHGVEEQDGARYLVLEYVEGETLAEVLDRGPMPLDEALDIGAQIAAGVEAAHDAGVIHRDLKPGNVIVTPDGQAKVLDFGLARVEESASSSGVMSEDPTITSPARHSPTIAGVILGTAAYMSPEQARGRRVDRRSDVWSFGVVLYEMLTGASPFVGETVSDSIGAVLHKSVDLSLLPKETPPRVRRVLRRCVERDKSLRYRDIGDVRVDLLSADAEDEELAQGVADGGWGVWRWAIVAVLLVGFLAVGWFGSALSRPEAAVSVGKFDLVVEGEDSKLGDSSLKISPDGTMLAYKQGDRIYVREMGSFESRALPGTDDAIDLFWSPDGKWIGYHTRQAIYKVSLTGGDSIKLTSERLQLGAVTGGGWTSDDYILFCDDEKGIRRVSARGGEPTDFLPCDSEKFVDYHDVSVVHGTDTALYIEHRRDMTYAVAAFDGERQVVIAEMEESPLAHPVYSATGHVLFSRGVGDSSVWAIAFDLDRMKALGDPFLVEPDAWQPSVSRDGTLAIQRGALMLSGSMAWVTRDGDIEPIEGDFEASFRPLLSPDATRLAFSAGPVTKFDIWVRDLDRGVNSRVTFDESFVVTTGWSPDSREIAVLNFRPGPDLKPQTRFLYSDGSGESRPPIEGMLITLDPAWSVAAMIPKFGRGTVEVFAISLEDPDVSTPVITLEGGFRGGLALSPDGTLLAYRSEESGEQQIYCTRFPDGSGKWQVSTQGGEEPAWSADGARLLFHSVGEDDAIYEVEVTREPALRFGLPVKVIDAKALDLDLMGSWAMAPDGERFVVKQSAEGGEGKDRAALSVIQNWFEEHRGR